MAAALRPYRERYPLRQPTQNWGRVFVLANGPISSSQNCEGEIRAAMVDADVVEVMTTRTSSRR